MCWSRRCHRWGALERWPGNRPADMRLAYYSNCCPSASMQPRSLPPGPCFLTLDRHPGLACHAPVAPACGPPFGHKVTDAAVAGAGHLKPESILRAGRLCGGARSGRTREPVGAGRRGGRGGAAAAAAGRLLPVRAPGGRQRAARRAGAAGRRCAPLEGTTSTCMHGETSNSEVPVAQRVQAQVAIWPHSSNGPHACTGCSSVPSLPMTDSGRVMVMSARAAVVLPNFRRRRGSPSR